MRHSNTWRCQNGKSNLPPPTAAVFCCASQQKLYWIHADIPEAYLSSRCERTHSDGLFSYLSSNYCAWFEKKKTVELLNIQQLCRPHLNKPTMQICFVFWKIQLLFPAVQSISSVPSAFTFQLLSCRTFVQIIVM